MNETITLVLLTVTFFLLNMIDVKQTLLGIGLGAKETNFFFSDLNDRKERRKAILRVYFIKLLVGMFPLLAVLTMLKNGADPTPWTPLLAGFVLILTVVTLLNQVELEHAIANRISTLKRRCKK